MNETDILKKLNDLEAIKQKSILEDTKAFEIYANALKQDLIEYGKEAKAYAGEGNKKRIRLLKNTNGYRMVFFQEVYVGLDDAIMRYGDVFVSGGDINRSGTGRTVIGSGFSRLAIPAGVEIIDVVGGHASFYAIEKDSNAMWVWGNNSQGCLGLGHNAVVPIPQRVSFRAKIKQVCSRSYTSSIHCCVVLLEDGSVWSCGRNTEGQLGIGNTIDSNRFVMVSSLTGIEEIWGVSNWASGVFARKGQDTYVWGWNGNGCLGLGKTTNVLAPELHPLKNIKAVYHYAMDMDGFRGTTFFAIGDIEGDKGEFYACGYNGERQCSQDNTNDVLTPVRIFVNAGNDQFFGGTRLGTCVYLNKNGSVWSWGYGQYGFGDLRSGNSLTKSLNQSVQFTSILGKPYHYQAFYAQDKNGDLWSFGYNNNALGRGNNTDNRTWEKIPTPKNIIDYDVCSWYLAERVFIATDGERLYACGTIYDGNIGYTTNVLQPQILPLGEK